MNLKSLLEWRAIKTYEFWKHLAGEFVATCFLMLAVCFFGVEFSRHSATPLVNEMRWGIGIGLVVAALVDSFSHLGGCHINPAVTCALLVVGKMPILKSVLYVLVQCTGSITASFIVYGLTPPQFRSSLGAMHIHEDLTPFQGFVIEMIVTFLLVFVVFASGDSANREVRLPNLSIGFVICMNIMATLNYTGCGMNPARALGPVVVLSLWKDHWVYWVGPIVGGILAALLYHFFFGVTFDRLPKSKIEPVLALKDIKAKNSTNDGQADRHHSFTNLTNLSINQAEKTVPSTVL